MIAICPVCGKRYRVADAAVPAAGREVRCTACRHGWTVWPDGATAPPPARSVEPLLAAVAPAVTDSFAAREPSPRLAMPVVASAQTVDGTIVAANPMIAATPSDVSAASSARSLNEEPPPRRRRGVIVAVTLVVVAVAAAAVVEFAPADTFDPPRLGLPAPRDLGLPIAQLDLPALDLPQLGLRRVPLVGDTLDGLINPPRVAASLLHVTAHGERRTLSNGTNVLLVSGSVANPTAAPVALTAIDAALRDPAGPVAIRWRIAAPVAVVAANGSVAFESVAANFPTTATVLQLTPR